MGRIRIVDDEIAERMYLEGKPLGEIAGVFGVTRSSISDRLRKRGVVTRRDARIRLTPQPMELAYLAGLFDGEGYVTIVLSKSERVHQYWLQIGIVNTNRAVLEHMEAVFGVGRLHARKPTARSLECWKWQATNRDAAHVLDLLRPYLRIKAEVAGIGSEFQARIRERNNNDWRAEMKARISALNRET